MISFILIEFKKYYPLLHNNGGLLIIFLLFTIFLLILILKTPLTIKVKIENFIIAYFALGLYLVLYIFFILYLRINLLGSNVNIKEIYLKITNFFININNYGLYNKMVIYLIMIIILLSWILIVIKLRNILGNKIWPLFLYHYILSGKNINPWLYRLIGIFNMKYSIEGISLKLINLIPFSLPTIKLILKILPFLILFLLFTFECYLNNFTIYYTLYYLLIFMFLVLYLLIDKNIHWVWRDEGLLTIIYNINYSSEIIYVNLREIDHQLMKLTLEDNYQGGRELLIHFYNYPFEHDINLLFRFEKIKIGNKEYYYNNHSRRVIEESELKKINGNYYCEKLKENVK